jgi:DNA-binding XRE family transcriptional regulator
MEQTEVDLDFIRAELNSGRNLSTIAKAVGVSRQTMRNLKRGQFQRVTTTIKAVQAYLEGNGDYRHGSCLSCHFGVRYRLDDGHGTDLLICRKHWHADILDRLIRSEGHDDFEPRACFKEKFEPRPKRKEKGNG